MSTAIIDIAKSVIELMTALIVLGGVITPMVASKLAKASATQKRLMLIRAVAFLTAICAALWGIFFILGLPIFAVLAALLYCAGYTAIFLMVPIPPQRIEIVCLVYSWVTFSFFALEILIHDVVKILEKMVH